MLTKTDSVLQERFAVKIEGMILDGFHYFLRKNVSSKIFKKQIKYGPKDE